MKKLSKILFVFVILGCSLFASYGFATPLLGELKTDGGSIIWPGYTEADTGAGAVALNDTDGLLDTAVATLYVAIGSYFSNSYLSFGIYDFDIVDDNVVIDNVQELGGSSFNLGDAQSIKFNVATDQASLDAGSNWFDMDSTFGFYLANSFTGETFYTHTSLNTDQFDHALIYDTIAITSGVGALVNSDVIVAFEDLENGGDKDYNDFVFGVSDVRPVPEPATMLLLGTGLIGMAAIGKKKFIK